MNGIVKGIFIFSAGIAIGGFAGYFVTKKTAQRMAEDEIAEMRAVMRDALKRKKEKLCQDIVPVIEDAEGIEEISASVETPAKNEKKGKDERRQYNKVVKDLGYDKVKIRDDPNPKDKYYDKKEEEEYHEYEEISGKANKNGGDNGAYVITVAEFSDEMDHYDKLTIYYYEDDDTLVDEGEEVITDVYAAVGDEALSSFGDGSEDPEVVYVRNDKRSIDYEIIRLSKSYAKDVLGYTDEDARHRARGSDMDD